MSDEHVQDARQYSRQHVLDACARATPEQAFLFLEHYRPRTDGGLDLTVLDHVNLLRKEVVLTDEQLGEATGLPVSYWAALRATLGEAEGGAA
jgi:hypothetical protein